LAEAFRQIRKEAEAEIDRLNAEAKRFDAEVKKKKDAAKKDAFVFAPEKADKSFIVRFEHRAPLEWRVQFLLADDGIHVSENGTRLDQKDFVPMLTCKNPSAQCRLTIVRNGKEEKKRRSPAETVVRALENLIAEARSMQVLPKVSR